MGFIADYRMILDQWVHDDVPITAAWMAYQEDQGYGYLAWIAAS